MKQIREIVLASGSPRRRELLAQVGINPRICPSRIVEMIADDTPEETVRRLSAQKAEDVVGQCQEGALVIGADTVVTAAGRILGKPKSHEEAFHMVSLLSGTTHQVYTGVTLIRLEQGGRRCVSFVEKTDVTVYPMSEGEIRAYAESNEPMDKAGAYGIQGRFAAFIKKIDGDYNNVVGLPVGRVVQEIKKLGGTAND